MFKKSIKVIASAMAAVMAAATVLGTAAKADVMFDTYDSGSTGTTTTVYDNYSGGYTGTTVYDNYDTVVYDNYDTVTYDYIYNPNDYVVTYDGNGNKIITYADGTVVYEMAKIKADTTYDFDKVIFNSSDYVWNYSDIGNAQRACGFTIKAPDSELDQFPYVEYSVISGDILQIKYSDRNGNEVVIRKSRGKVDLSGDSSKYSVEKKEKLEKAACILYGGRYGYSKAIAAKSGYSYSVRANFAMTKSDMEDIIKVMVK